MEARGLYHDMVLRQMETDGQPKNAVALRTIARAGR